MLLQHHSLRTWHVLRSLPNLADFASSSHFYFPASGQAVVTGVVPSSPRHLSLFLSCRGFSTPARSNYDAAEFETLPSFTRGLYPMRGCKPIADNLAAYTHQNFRRACRLPSWRTGLWWLGRETRWSWYRPSATGRRWTSPASSPSRLSTVRRYDMRCY